MSVHPRLRSISASWVEVGEKIVVVGDRERLAQDRIQQDQDRTQQDLTQLAQAGVLLLGGAPSECLSAELSTPTMW